MAMLSSCAVGRKWWEINGSHGNHPTSESEPSKKMSEILDQNVIKLQQVMDSKSLGSAASPSPLKTKIQLQAVQRADMTLLFLYI